MLKQLPHSHVVDHEKAGNYRCSFRQLLPQSGTHKKNMGSDQYLTNTEEKFVRNMDPTSDIHIGNT